MKLPTYVAFSAAGALWLVLSSVSVGRTVAERPRTRHSRLSAEMVMSLPPSSRVPIPVSEPPSVPADEPSLLVPSTLAAAGDVPRDCPPEGTDLDTRLGAIRSMETALYEEIAAGVRPRLPVPPSELLARLSTEPNTEVRRSLVRMLLLAPPEIVATPLAVHAREVEADLRLRREIELAVDRMRGPHRDIVTAWLELAAEVPGLFERP